MAPVRTSVATEFNSGERTYSTTKSHLPSIRNMMPMVPWGFILTQRRKGAEYVEVFRLDFAVQNV